MSSLNQIKKKIKYVDSAKKITKAMYLVSTAKLKKTRFAYDLYSGYYKSIFEIAGFIFDQVKSVNFLNKINAKKRKLIIIMGSDIGLCGAYNNSIIKEVNLFKNEEDLFILIGNKMQSYWKNKISNEKIIATYSFDSLTNDYETSSLVSEKIFSLYQDGVVNQINIFYTKFVNSINFVPVNFQLMPIDKVKYLSKYKDESKIKQITSFEPNIEEIVTNFISLLFNAVIYGCIVESWLSENASRRNAMDKANDSAEKLKDNLIIEYNRKRQAAITREISEIISGMNI